MLYSNVQARVMASLGIVSKSLAGLPNTFMLLASGIGGVLFGFIADRVGRKKALMLSILTYSVCSLGSGLATSIAVLIFFRFALGLGMGGEWNTGARAKRKKMRTAMDVARPEPGLRTSGLKPLP